MSSGDDTEPLAFGTDGWRAAGEAFTLERVRQIAGALASYLDDKDRPGPIAVGYDSRRTSVAAAEALAAVLVAEDRSVTLASEDCPTPVLGWTVRDGPYAAGLMVTASHNPPEYNGVKVLTSEGAPALPAMTDALEARLAPVPGPAVDVREHEAVTETALAPAYREHAISFVDADLGGVPIAYDGMHGSGRNVTPALLEAAGATVTRRRCDRDPTFGGVPPEPSPKTAAAVCERVQSGEAALGFVNDGDADRLGVLTPERGYLDPNVLLAVIYDYLLETASGDVVRTVSTSSLVDGVARAHGRQVHETSVGFKWVAEALAAHDTLAGGEESGGYGITAHLRNKDGVLLALLLAAAHVDRPLDDRIDAILDKFGPISQGRRSITCPEDRKSAVLSALEDSLPERVAGTAVDEISTVDGFKCTLADGSWMLVRPSGTEPKLRIYAEATTDGRVDELLAAGEALLDAHLG